MSLGRIFSDRVGRHLRRGFFRQSCIRFVRTMLPYVDSFRPIHNLASMADLCRALSGGRDSSDNPKARLSAVG
jgi:hypothetical protein